MRAKSLEGRPYALDGHKWWTFHLVPGFAIFFGMLLTTQGLAEYVAITATSASATLGRAVGQAARLVSEHVLVVIFVLAGIVLVFSLRAGRRRRY